MFLGRITCPCIKVCSPPLRLIPLKGVVRGMWGRNPGRFISVTGRETPGHGVLGFKEISNKYQETQAKLIYENRLPYRQLNDFGLSVLPYCSSFCTIVLAVCPIHPHTLKSIGD